MVNLDFNSQISNSYLDNLAEFLEAKID